METENEYLNEYLEEFKISRSEKKGVRNYMQNNAEQGLHVLDLLQRHRSIRKFTHQKISKEHLDQILFSAQMAATSSHVQAYSIVGVTDQEKKKQLAEWAGGQSYVESCAHFFVFCADLYRLHRVAQKEGEDVSGSLEYTEMFMVATIDAALAAQNAAVAAESLGLGIVYIGGLRNEPDKVSQLLQLPDKVYPVFGMCLGYPDQDPGKKPRLPREAIYFENEYQGFEKVEAYINTYDQTMKQYYLDRTNGNRSDTWSEMMASMLRHPRRAHMKSFLHSKGFPLK
jgi:FMN reductase (NADPH)